MEIVERDDDRPAYGYGQGSRPLWTVRDRDAEKIRRVLRKAGCKEFTETGEGFAVEGGQNGAPFAVACAYDERDEAALELTRYRQALTGAGMSVEPDPNDDKALIARLPNPAA